MKKIIALMLVILTVAALFVSCANNNDNPADNTTTTQDPNVNVTPVDGFTAVNETVYVIAEGGLNVRRTPEAVDDSNKISSIAYGKDVTRTGINETTGWSQILFNNEVAYVKSEYLSTTKPADMTTGATDTDVPDDKFTACNDETEVYVTDSSNNDAHIENGDATVYSAPNRSTNIGSLKDGTAVKRVAVYYEKEDDHTYGWSKIEVTVENETKTYYIRNSQLKIEMVKEAAAQ